MVGRKLWPRNYLCLRCLMRGLNCNGPTSPADLLFDFTFENFDFGFVSMFLCISESLGKLTLVLKVVIQQ